MKAGTCCDTIAASGPSLLGGHPYMMSALRGEEGVSPKEDVVREVG